MSRVRTRVDGVDVERLQQTSPVLDVSGNPVPVSISLEGRAKTTRSRNA